MRWQSLPRVVASYEPPITMSSSKIQAIRGMNDILPEDAHLWDFFETTVQDLLRAFGYREIRMPLVEKTELFARSIGEATDIVEKEMYSFQDSLNGDNLTLRPEGTASCVRAVIEHNLLYQGPQRLWYSGPMFRHERPQKGRYRQFHQVGVETFGFTGPDIDAEHIVMCSQLWRNLGLESIVLQLNTLGDPKARRSYRHELVSYFQDHWNALDSDSRRRLERNPLRLLDSKNPEMQSLIEGAPTFSDFLDGTSINHFRDLQNYLRLNGVAFDLNPRLVRGLDYYNNTVFEWVTTELGAQGTICAGGRYDGLVSQLGGSQTCPACGFAIGVERVIELLKICSGSIPKPAIDAYVVRQGHLADSYSWKVAESLRSTGLSVILHCGGGSMSSQMKKAASSGARYAVIIGETEAIAQQLTLKQLRTGEQGMVGIAQAIEIISMSRDQSPITNNQSRS